MTRQKTLKRRVRGRMEKTGESYTAARAHLLGPSANGGPPAAPRTSGEAVLRATGRGWDEWFALLDAWGAEGHAHGEIAAWLRTEHGVPSWWAQNVSVEYEVARGMRVRGGKPDGTFAGGASRTVAVGVDRLWEAWLDPAVRERWLPGAALRERALQPGRSARFDWGEDGTRVIVWFEAKGDAKSTVGVQHERLPDAAAAEDAKTFWRERLGALKRLLEDRPHG